MTLFRTSSYGSIQNSFLELENIKKHMEEKVLDHLTLLDKSGNKVTTKEVLNKENFEKTFRTFCAEAKEKGYQLIISSYEHLSRQIPLLKLLEDIRFKVEDFASLDAQSIPIVIHHIELERSAFGQKISRRLKDRRKAGLEIGNPEIAKHAKDSAIKQRVRLAIFDEVNLKAAVQIFKLKKEGETFNAIAKYLNDSGLQTRREGSFYAKSVERIYQRYIELEDNFSSQQTTLDTTKNIASDLVVNGFEFKYEFADTISLSLDNLNGTAEVKIYDNKSPQAIHTATTSNDHSFELQIAKTRALLPGLHYLVLEKDGEKIFVQQFYIAHSIKEMIQE